MQEHFNILYPMMAGIIVFLLGIIGFLLKNLLRKIDKLIETVNNITLQDVEQMKDIEKGIEERGRIFSTLGDHGKRITNLEVFNSSLTLVHNKEHPDNKIGNNK